MLSTLPMACANEADTAKPNANDPFRYVPDDWHKEPGLSPTPQTIGAFQVPTLKPTTLLPAEHGTAVSAAKDPPDDVSEIDNEPDMRLAWDAWHKRVAGAISDRCIFMSKAAFKHSQPLVAVVSYTVTRDHHILNVKVQQKTPNLLYKVLIYQVIRSFDGDASVLEFPRGSRRAFVQKLATFTQNYEERAPYRMHESD